MMEFDYFQEELKKKLFEEKLPPQLSVFESMLKNHGGWFSKKGVR